MNPEGGRVVATVQGAWAYQLIAVAFEVCAKIVGFKHAAYTHLLFEISYCAHVVFSACKEKDS